jgi:hypothetical protein
VDWLNTLGFAMGSAWLSGINLYAAVGTLGLLQRFGLVKLPGDLTMLGNSWIIGIAVFLYLIEFVADKVPVVDSIWDAVHTFIRVPAGAVLASSAFAEFDPAVRLAALLAGGSIALGSHGTKASLRLTANTSPEPASNIALSVGEDILTVAMSLLMAFHPVVLIGIVVVFLVVALWIIRRIWRAVRGLFGPRPAVSPGQV